MKVPFIDLKPQIKAVERTVKNRFDQILEHGRFILGPEVEECEKALAQFVGAKHAIACASGTDALVMALLALDIKAGDEVITTPFSFVATAESIVLCGATPVYVDIEPRTYNIDPKKIAAAITDKTKAIMPVSLYGLTADFSPINELARKHNIPVIEDAAQSFGALYNNQRSCNLSAMGCTSFFPAKPLGCFGDGGAVFTSDDELATQLKQIRMHGDRSRYDHIRLGINGRLDSIQCAVITAKLERYPWELEQRQRLASNYNEAFLAQAKIKTPMVPSHCQSVWAQYTVQVDDRQKFQEHMQSEEIPTSVHYPLTIPDQPAYKENGRFEDITQARQAAQNVVSLPMFPDMNEEQQKTVIEAVLRY